MGKDGWLFYYETLNDFLHKDILSDDEIEEIALQLQAAEQLCNEHGIEFLFVVAPNKNSIYPQYMPYLGGRHNPQNNVQMLFERLEEKNVSALNLIEPLRSRESLLYHKMDSHWNDLGAAVANDEILRALNRDNELFEHDYFEHWDYIVVYDFEADLYTMLYPKGTRMDANVQFLREFTYEYYTPMHTIRQMTIRTVSDGGHGTALVYRDSFGDALYRFMAESFDKTIFRRNFVLSLDMALEYDVDTVIIVMAERSIAHFSSYFRIDQ